MPDAAHVRVLDDNQLERFNHHLQSPQTQAHTIERLRERFGDGPFTFVDVGGGAGSFTDVILAEFPNAKGIVLDNSDYLLSKNTPLAAKQTVCASATEMSAHIDKGSCDVVFMNLMLHHMVGDSYALSRQLQTQVLNESIALLKPGGAISIIEQCFNGLVLHNLPGWLIYQATSSKLLARITKRLKANTAGVGVCFLSTDCWRKRFAAHPELGTPKVLGHQDPGIKDHHPLVRWALHIRSIDRTHFWMERR